VDLFAPVSMDNNPEMQKIINEIGINAYKFFAKIAKNKNPDFKGVQWKNTQKCRFIFSKALFHKG